VALSRSNRLEQSSQVICVPLTNDLSKPFDKVDHCALFMKLMKRNVPLKLLDTSVYWLQNSWSCVKWKSVLSQFFKLDYDIRQGSVLSPYFFAIGPYI